MGNASTLVRPRSVTGDGAGLVSHAGIAWLAETADLAGLTAGLSAAMTSVPQRRHDPGRTLAQMILALADGATCLSDLAAVRAQESMFGQVASEATVWRTFNQIGSVELRGVATARAAARERAWAVGAGPAGEELIVDFDATLINTKADKQDARPNYKRGYGHHPLLAMIAETDEVLCAKLRPGNAGANTAADHVTVLADALAQLPASWRSGHEVGDDPNEVEHQVLIRADAGGASHWFAEECVDRNLEFSFGFHIDHRVRDGVMCVPTGCWHRAIDPGGARRDGAEVIELTDFVDLGSWPEGTRLIVRRERPHPGAQLTLFDTIEGFRHTAFITNQTSYDVAALELQQRQRARAENVIRDAKACGLANLPFDCIVNNEAWMNLCFAANDLLGWAQRIGCVGQLRRATPKTIRHRLLHIAARISPNSRRLRLDQDWPWTQLVIDAIRRVRTAFQALTVTTAPSGHTAQ
ncbi:MAG: IS1380 family transposase [Actinomycetia bacterium]|nr:IS1380 family transposase [Actinomycetes bacterium]